MAFFLLVLLVGLHNYQVNCDSSTETDEDDSSKVRAHCHLFSYRIIYFKMVKFVQETDVDNPETYIGEQTDEMYIQKQRSNQPEKPPLTSSRTSNDPLAEVAQLTYRGSIQSEFLPIQQKGILLDSSTMSWLKLIPRVFLWY